MPNPAPAKAFIARCAIFLIATSTLFLAGCSTMRVIDSDVTAFQTWKTAPPGPGTPYRFERLPSQQATAAQQGVIEAAARPALAKVGLVPNDTAPRYSVQVLLNTQLVERVLADPFGYGGYGGFGGFGGFPGHGRFGPGFYGHGGSRGASFGLAFPLWTYESATFKHELTVLMRDLATQQVAFETRALHFGPWNDSLNILPALLDAALRGFPQPPEGTRRINVELQQPVNGP
ncbi:MAG: DUF4136 domain-containing protein [Polaromonas sp.]